MKKIFSKNFIVLLDQGLFSGGSFITTLLLARILSPFDFGVFSSLLLFNYALISGLNALVIQPFQVSLSKKNDRKSYVFFTFVLQQILLLLVLLVLTFISTFKFEFLNDFSEITFYILLYFFGFINHDYFRKIFLAKGEVSKATLLDFITVLIQVALLLVLWNNGDKGFVNVIEYLSFSYIPGIILSLILISKKTPSFIQLKDYLNDHFHQGKWLLLTSITQWWSSNLFVVSSGVFLGVTTLGAFRLVQSLFGILNLVLQTFENFVLPETSRRYAISVDSAKKYLRGITIKSSVLFGSMLFFLFIFSDFVISLVGGEKYLPFSYIVKGMSVLYLFIFIGYPVRISIRILILNRVFFTGYLLSFIFSLLSFNFLLGHFGVNGAILGLIFSQIITLIYWQFILVKHKFILWK